MSHRPIYCLNVLDPSCNQLTLDRPKIRKGIRWLGDLRSPLKYGLEDLFFNKGVGK